MSRRSQLHHVSEAERPACRRIRPAVARPGVRPHHLLRSEGTVEQLPRTHMVSVAALVDHASVICDPDTTIREATSLISHSGSGAILVRTRDGLGIVTDADLRDRVLLADAPADAAVATIMSTPVTTVDAHALAADAAAAMIDADVKHVVAVDAQGSPVGIVSADGFMTLDAVSPLALRHAIAAAPDADALAKVSTRLPGVFLGLVDARLEASEVSRILTAQYDAITARLLELAIAENGRPPVAFAWLALGSAARSELTLASDQDNALAYADADDPAVDTYFAGIAQAVTAGLSACGLGADVSGVTAANPQWRLPASAWTRRLVRCFAMPNESHIMGASIAFDFRRVAGDLGIVGPLSRVVQTAPHHPGFLAGMAATVTAIRSPLSLRRRLTGSLDVKRSGLLPIANLARYFALSHGLTVAATLDRLAAIEHLGDLDPAALQSLRSAFALIADLRLQHHADLLRAGGPLDNTVDTAKLPRLVHAGLQEALRVVDDVQRLLPPVLHGWA